MKRFLFVIVALVFYGVAAAETLSWEPPTTRVDGTPFDASKDLSSYQLYCDDLAAVPVPSDTSDGQYKIPLAEIFDGYGTFSCALTAVDLDGLESARSNSVDVVYPVALPSKPTTLIILTGGGG